MNLLESVKILARTLSTTASTEQQINDSISQYYDEINKTEDPEEVGRSMKYLSEIFSFDNLKNGSMASLICGTLIEHGFPASFIIDDYINFFKKGMEESLPFIQNCMIELPKINEEEENPFDLIERKKEELKTTPLIHSICSLESLDAYYPCGISIFSSGKEEFKKAKQQLGEVADYSIFNSSYYWFSILFEVLFDEPIIVIDLDTKKGFKGKMSGVVDNFQLQLLLMGLHELNDEIEISEKQLDVVSGYDVQQLDESISGKWNMYNWEYVKNREADSRVVKDSQFWIWSEGNPADISKYKDHRVILLGKPAYSRGLSIQRTFKNLKAEITIEEELNSNQIHSFLNELKYT